MTSPEMKAIAVISALLVFFICINVIFDILDSRAAKKHKEHEEFMARISQYQGPVTIKLTRKQAAQVYLKLYDPDALAGTGVCETLLQIQSFF